MSGTDDIVAKLIQYVEQDAVLLAWQPTPVHSYIGQLPDDVTYPAVRMYPVGGETVNSLQGENGLRNMVWAIDVFSSKLLDAIRIGERIRTTLATNMKATLDNAPFSLSEPDLHLQRYTFQVSLWA